MNIRLLALLLAVTAANVCAQTGTSGPMPLDPRLARQIARPGDEHKPDFPPSYSLHVNRTQIEGTNEYGADDFWSLQGFDVAGVISRLYDVNRVRIKLPGSFQASDHYEFSMVLPKPESREQMTERFRQGIQDYFHLAATRENHLMDVYVVTAPDRKPPAAKAQPEEGGGSFASWISFETPKVENDAIPKTNVGRTFSIRDVNGIAVEGTTDQFCETLERQLDRPVVNEANLQGTFRFDVKPSQTDKNDFLDRLREQLGLVITPAQRNVEILVFRPR